MSMLHEPLICISAKHQTLARIGCWSFEAEHQALSLSPMACTLMGLEAVSAQGAHLARKALNARVHPLDRVRVERNWREALQSGSFDMEYRLEGPEDAWIWERADFTLDSDGRLLEGVGILQDVSLHRQGISSSLARASHDVLTGLPNRALLAEHLDLVLPLARRNEAMVGVLFIDLDRFKQVNDVFGHAMGDELLRQVSSRMTDCLRESDMVARQGGDEFIVVLQEIGHESDAGLVALKLLEALTRPFDLQGIEAHIGGSIGISLFPADGQDAETLFQNADLAMYQAKTAGRETLRFFEPAMREDAVRRHDLEVELRHALANQEFILEYQPIYDMVSNLPSSVEALIRWQHPSHGRIGPDAFIPAAEENGLIRDIGQWVVLEVCRQMHAWQGEGIDLRVSLNVSSRQIPDGLPLDWLREQLVAHAIEPQRLVFEITEGVLLKDTPASQRWIDGVTKLGIRLALDDFGTGYASLGFLRQFRMDQLKIDRSFVMAMPGQLGLVKSIIDIGNNLGLEVTAEGVEDAERLAMLAELGCHSAQGFHLARPMSAIEISSLLKASCS